ncbi:MAG TPA: toprim domain-containing protein [Pyrinomonadaceae bacterium]|nr:toprim domain-containing protein [Pyrinomonadaceae bacterium]
MRVESDCQTRNSGWLHKSNDVIPVYTKPKVVEVEQTIDVESLWLKWFEATDYKRMGILAAELGVTADVLCALGCAWNDQAWAFPMKDANDEIVGIRLRGTDGRKWAVKGSKQGLFIPSVDIESTMFIVEGVTDAAAALTLGLYAIGRPSCLGCEEMIVNHIRAHKIRRAVIVADNDEPGQRGAMKLKNHLPVFSCIWTPPTKDLREFVNLGGNSLLIEASIKDLVWERAA